MLRCLSLAGNALFLLEFNTSMNKYSIRRITIIASLALIGLIAIQVYWVNNAISLGEERFEQSVNEALTNVVSRMEKLQAAAKITKKFKFRKQGIRWFTNDGVSKGNTKFVHDTVGDRHPFSLEKNKVNVKIVEDYAADSNGVIVKRTRQKNYSSDSTSSNFDNRTKNDGPTFFQQFGATETNQNWISHKNAMVNDIFDELVSINVYNDYNHKTDTLLLDSILRVELLDKGISAHYIFGVTEEKNLPIDSSKLSPREREIGSSPYKVNLSPDNIFIKPQYLSVLFPSQNRYLLSSMWGLLLVSLLFMLTLIYSFYYTISTIFKQKKLSEININV